MKLIIRYLVGVILGEEDFQFALTPRILKSSSIFFKTGYGAGYKVDVNGRSVIINRVNKFAGVFVGPPLYHFKGAIQQDSEETEATGRIMMMRLPKYFILVWTALVFLALIASVIMTMFLSIEFIISPSQAIGKNLLTAGVMLGGVASLSVFGVIVISSIKLFSRHQKECLKQFCKSLRKASSLDEA